MRVIRIAGAPASGKTTLRLALARLLELPSFAIDDERLRLMAPGEVWPANDELAWRNLRARMEAVDTSIVETSGLSPRDTWLYRDCTRFTILTVADHYVRRARLIARARSGHRLARTPGYVDRVSRLGDPIGLSVDAIWQGDVTARLAPLIDRVRAWLVPVAA